MTQDSEATPKHRPSLHNLMIGVAKLSALRSSCGRKQVGAIVTNEEMTQIDAFGYNGTAKGHPNHCESDKPGLCGCVHAEENALIKANYNRKNKKMFITCSPCRTCAKLIINGDIKEVYFEHLYRDASSLPMLFKSKIRIFQVNYEEDTIMELVSTDEEGSVLKWESKL